MMSGQAASDFQLKNGRQHGGRRCLAPAHQLVDIHAFGAQPVKDDGAAAVHRLGRARRQAGGAPV